LFAFTEASVEKLNTFGAFCSLPGFRKNGLLHISQISNSRCELLYICPKRASAALETAVLLL